MDIKDHLHQNPLPAVLLLVFFMLASSCVDRDERTKRDVLGLSREAALSLDSVGSELVQARIDSLDSLKHVPDSTLGRLCVDLSTQLRQSRQYHAMNEYTNRSLDLLEGLSHQRPAIEHQKIELQISLGTGYSDLGLLDRYMNILIKVLPTARRLGFTDLEILILSDMAYVYNEKHQWDKAIGLLAKASRLAEKESNINGIVFSLNNMAWAYAGKNDFDHAIEYAMLALHHVPPGDTLLAMRTRVNVGSYYNRMHEYTLAKRQLEMACAYYDRHDVSQELGIALPKLSISLMHLGKMDSAKLIIERAERLLPLVDVPAKTAIISTKVVVCRESGDLTQENAMLRQLCILNDSIIRGDNANILSQLYEEELERSDSNLIAYQGLRIMFMCTIALIVLALAVVSFCLFRWHKRLKHELQGVRDDCSNLGNQLVEASIERERSDSLIQSLSKSLQDISRGVMDASRKDLLQSLRSITSQVMRAEGEHGSDLLTLAHADFFHRLMDQFPELTNNDLRVCALLRRGISSKEIAEILCREPHTIDIARMRIRRKCGLLPEDDLSQFMMKF